VVQLGDASVTAESESYEAASWRAPARIDEAVVLNGSLARVFG
jgi:hypothetical protein